jgi:hypothetical protein
MPIWLYKFRVLAAPESNHSAHLTYSAACHAAGFYALAKTASCQVLGGSHPSLAVLGGRL